MPTLVAALYHHRDRAGSANPISFTAALAWQLPMYLSWVVLGAVVLWAGQRLRLNRSDWLAPLPTYLVLAAPVIGAHAALVVTLDAWMSAADDPILRQGLVTRWAERLPVDLLVYCALVGTLYAVEFYSQARERERTQLRLAGDLATAQLQALKMQLHPHFLFNTLQNIAFLIPRLPDDAARMTVLLGDLLRGTLDRAATQLVPLRDEMVLTERYLEIERIRFRDRLRITTDVHPAVLGWLVPDLILQPIIENALRHGIAPQPDGGTVHVRGYGEGDRLRLLISDNGIGLDAQWRDDGSMDGVGLRVVRDRLRGLFGGEHLFRVSPNPDGRGTLVLSH